MWEWVRSHLPTNIQDWAAFAAVLGAVGGVLVWLLSKLKVAERATALWSGFRGRRAARALADAKALVEGEWPLTRSIEALEVRTKVASIVATFATGRPRVRTALFARNWGARPIRVHLRRLEIGFGGDVHDERVLLALDGQCAEATLDPFGGTKEWHVALNLEENDRKFLAEKCGVNVGSACHREHATMAAAFVYGTVIAGDARVDDHRFGLGIKLEIDDYKAPPFIRPPEEIM